MGFQATYRSRQGRQIGGTRFTDSASLYLDRGPDCLDLRVVTQGQIDGFCQRQRTGKILADRAWHRMAITGQQHTRLDHHRNGLQRIDKRRGKIECESGQHDNHEDCPDDISQEGDSATGLIALLSINFRLSQIFWIYLMPNVH